MAENENNNPLGKELTGSALINYTVEYLLNSNGVRPERQEQLAEICKETINSFVYSYSGKSKDIDIDHIEDSLLRVGIAMYMQAYANFCSMQHDLFYYVTLYPRLADKKYCSSYTNQYEYAQSSFDMFLEYMDSSSDFRKAIELAAQVKKLEPQLKEIILNNEEYAEIREKCTFDFSDEIEEGAVVWATPQDKLVINTLYRMKLGSAIEKYHIKDRFVPEAETAEDPMYYPYNEGFTKELQKYAGIDWENTENCLFDKALIEARALKEQPPIKEDLLQISAKKVENVFYPLDKVNSSEEDIWHILQEDTGGQLTFAMESGKDKRKGKQLDLTYSINFDSLEEDAALHISKRLEPYDKRVYIAAAALYNAGNEYITLTQIHHAMGNKTDPSPNQTEKINNSITKMAAAEITIDNAMEAAAYSGYPHFKYDGRVLPMERMSAVVSGKTTEAAIKLFREPPLITFARQRKQIATIKPKLLAAPVSQTNRNIDIQDYLISRIERAKSKKQEKILIETLCKKTGITDYKKRKKRYNETFSKCLQYYKDNGMIKGYTINDADIIVYISTK